MNAVCPERVREYENTRIREHEASRGEAEEGGSPSRRRGRLLRNRHREPDDRPTDREYFTCVLRRGHRCWKQVYSSALLLSSPFDPETRPNFASQFEECNTCYLLFQF